jgi:pyruvate/2-oxoglutarate dehydrogenase complex dihydrolipoamide acyltransferase (E2) component
MALIEVKMPKYGMTMTHGIIAKWHVSEGDRIEKGQTLLTIETEKVSTDLEAPVSGTVVELTFAQDDEAEVGAVIAYIEES